MRLIDQTNNVEKFRKKESFWQYATSAGYFSANWIEGARSGSFLIFNLSSFSVIMIHNIYCNRWQWHAQLYLKDLTSFICLIYLSTLSTYYICNFFFFNYRFLLLSLLLFIYYYYGSVDLFG